jgi:hypothetical protein
MMLEAVFDHLLLIASHTAALAIVSVIWKVRNMQDDILCQLLNHV